MNANNAQRIIELEAPKSKSNKALDQGGDDEEVAAQ